MATQIPPEFINDLIERADILEIIQARVKLKQHGREYIGLCPFHQEKTPSFHVIPHKQFYYCFGCKAHGNAIGFLMAYDHLTFIDAVQEIASRLGLEIPKTSQQSAQKDHQADYAILQSASKFYQLQLKNSNVAIQYLKQRGITGITAKHFSLGYAPDAWDALLKHFTRQTAAKPTLLANGLVIQKESGKCFDRFRHRIMFPIRDSRGRIIAFGGRTLGNAQAKYMNSPETDLFHKSYELYGLYETLQQRDIKRILICEGYIDVIALHQAGIPYAVATLGTATNIKHLQKVLRYSNHIIFCFDGDQAGKEAAWKALTMALPILRDGIHIQFMFLPTGEDPDSLIRKLGADKFSRLIDESKPLNDVFFAVLQQQIPLNNVADKAHYAKQAAQYLNQMPRGLYQELLYQELAKVLKVSSDELRDLMSRQSKKTHIQATAPETTQKVEQSTPNPAHTAMAILLQKPKLASQLDIDLALLAKRHGSEINLLISIIKSLRQNPALSIGSLLGQCETKAEQALIAKLASQHLPIPNEGLFSELEGACQRLQQQGLEATIEQLINKMKHSGLSPEEKNLLQRLLTNQHLDTI